MVASVSDIRRRVILMSRKWTKGTFAGNQPFILGVKQWMPVDLPLEFDDDDDDDGASKQDLLDLDPDHVPHFSCLPPGTPPIPKSTNTNCFDPES